MFSLAHLHSASLTTLSASAISKELHAIVLKLIHGVVSFVGTVIEYPDAAEEYVVACASSQSHALMSAKGHAALLLG